MAETFRLKSREDGTLLELRPREPDYMVAELRGPALQAFARVYTYDPLGLGEYFSALAADWRGWVGERFWGSLEAEFTLTARSSRTGQISVTAFLRDASLPTWRVELELVLEAGQLERIAGNAIAFERHLGELWKTDLGHV